MGCNKMKRYIPFLILMLAAVIGLVADSFSGGGGSGTSGAITQIAIASPSATNVVTFNSIPGTFTDLQVVVRGRSTAAATVAQIQLTLNNDTAANYQVMASQITSNILQNIGSTGDTFVGSAVTGAPAIAAANAPAGAAGYGEYWIYGYAGTAFNKYIQFLSGFTIGAGTANFFALSGYGEHLSTLAVTRVDVTLSAGNFVAGSTVTLYGRQ